MDGGFEDYSNNLLKEDRGKEVWDDEWLKLIVDGIQLKIGRRIRRMVNFIAFLSSSWKHLVRFQGFNVSGKLGNLGFGLKDCSEVLGDLNFGGLEFGTQYWLYFLGFN